MATYSAALVAGDREKIASFYHPDGAYFASTSFRFHKDADAIRTRYAQQWSPPRRFEWCDLHYDVVSADVVNVLGFFRWGTAKGTTEMSYVGTLQKVDGAFRIRMEVESDVPAGRRSAQCPR